MFGDFFIKVFKEKLTRNLSLSNFSARYDCFVLKTKLWIQQNDQVTKHDHRGNAKKSLKYVLSVQSICLEPKM